MNAHEIDYRLYGDDMQFVEIAAPSAGGRSVGEGSILGGIGDWLDGDD
ncbi:MULTISPECIES: hypothetical protein [Geobacillus]|nr:MULTISPECIES: hypothetical protein [Geobacillus]EQB94273.1 hypothetical protein GA8_17985 [Geobacillus sp. A8]ESU73507.1 hypothetical protein T260_02635 [Geobacillus sp. MAS1]MED3666661.1 hypothetical protein [Geobacillus kaustophilus]QNU23324.1 hypothetical protein IC805_15325 [Geobacillus thermoleovorans]